MSTSKKLILYGAHMSPPTRAIRMVLAELQIPYELKIIDLHAGEHLKPEFVAKNPQHTIPTLELEDGRCIWDSHAVMAYLARRYAKNDQIYPKDFYQRAVVDQRLHFENGILFMEIGRHKIGKLLHTPGTTQVQLKEVIDGLVETFALLETFLGDNSYMAGKNLTIADLSMITTVVAIDIVAPIDAARYPKLAAWFQRIKSLPYYKEINDEGVNMLVKFLKDKIAEIK